MRCVVVGLGTFGRSLAAGLQAGGVDVIAIDSDPALVEEIKDQVSVAVRLDATDEEELAGQRIGSADVGVVAVGEDFESAALSTALLKKLGVPRVIARATTPLRARLLKLIGADETVTPEEEAARELVQRVLRPALVDYLKLTTAQSMIEVTAPLKYNGKSLAELNLRDRFRVNVVAIKHRKPIGDPREDAHEEFLIDMPAGGEVVKKGDVLVVMGRDDDLSKLLHDIQD